MIDISQWLDFMCALFVSMQLSHEQAVRVLSAQFGIVTLTVITLSTIYISEMDEDANFPSYLWWVLNLLRRYRSRLIRIRVHRDFSFSYPFFAHLETTLSRIDKIPGTPTAPRTPPPYS